MEDKDKEGRTRVVGLLPAVPLSQSYFPTVPDLEILLSLCLAQQLSLILCRHRHHQPSNRDC